MENDICFSLAIRKASRVITRLYEDKLSTLGLKAGQFSLLKVIKIREVTNNKELQNILAMDQTTLSRNIKPLERDGYVNISPNEKDKRVKQISLSDEGATLYEAALPLWVEAQKELIDKVGRNGTDSLTQMTRLFVDKLS